MEDLIKNNKIGKVFDIIVTDAGKLPSKHIISIVMPYKYQDKNNEQLRNAFSLVIDKAIELKYKSIAIPYIGTGANGYEYADIHQALNDVMFNYQYKQGIAIDILSVRFHTTKDVRDSDSKNIINRRDDQYFDIGYYYDINNTKIIQDAIRKNYKKEDELEVESLYSPADFIRTAIKRAGGYTKVPEINEVLNNDARKNIAKFKKIIKKEEIYKTSIILGLNFTQIIQFMEISGYTFSPVTNHNIDMEVFKFIVNNNGFTKPYHYIANYFIKLSDVVFDAVLEYEAPKRKKKNTEEI